ncbi:MAG: hypothetical protein K6D38_04905 [Pseudobutyrivibrio sp.]|nr:hypothetical protein [Pseudobutyrivibrio sp.]
MKKRNLLVFALCAATAIGVGAVNTIDAEAKTITCAQDASQVTYGTLTDSQKEMVAKYFNAEYYASQYFDVVQAVGDDREALLKHFCDCGIWEGRHGWPEFDVSAYASAYNLKEAYGKDIAKYYEDYFTVGVAEGRYLTTVELCEANGIKVESLFGEYKFLDANIYKAASLMGTADYNAVAQAVTVAAETHEPVVVQVPNPNGGEPTEFVVADPTNPVMEKCKNLTLIGTLKCDEEGLYGLYYLTRTSTGVAISDDYAEEDPVLYSTDGKGVTEKPRKDFADIHFGDDYNVRYSMQYQENRANPDGKMEAACVESLDPNKVYIGMLAERVFYTYDGETGYHQPTFFEGSQESITPAVDIKGTSGHAYFAEAPEGADESTVYNVGVDIKQKDDRYVDVTFGIYNEEHNFANVVEYNNLDMDDYDLW